MLRCGQSECSSPLARSGHMWPQSDQSDSSPTAVLTEFWRETSGAWVLKQEGWTAGLVVAVLAPWSRPVCQRRGGSTGDSRAEVTERWAEGTGVTPRPLWSLGLPHWAGTCPPLPPDKPPPFLSSLIGFPSLKLKEPRLTPQPLLSPPRPPSPQSLVSSRI